MLHDTGHCDNGIAAVDPWRITVGVEGLGMTGFEAEATLQDWTYLLPELATHKVASCNWPACFCMSLEHGSRVITAELST